MAGQADLLIALRVTGQTATVAAIQSVNKTTQALGVTAKATSGSLSAMGTAIGAGGRVARVTVGTFGGLHGATKMLGGSAQAAGVSFRGMAVAVAAGQVAATGFLAATRGLTDLFKTSANQAAGFEAQISAIAAVSGATAAEMKTLQQLALDLGAATSFSATEAAQGIEELVKAGVSIKDIMAGAGKASLDLAAAGAVSVADAAEIASNAMNAFSIKGADMAKVADTIAGAANASAISVTDFKFSLGAVGAVAAAAGLSFNDTAVAIAELGQAGIKGSDAGTSLKAFIAGLTPSTKAAKEAMKDLGLWTKSGGNAFFDSAGKMKSMAEIQQILAKATKNLTEQEKLMAFETIFGSDAIRAASVLSKQGAAGYREMADAMGKVSAAEVADKRLDNLSGSIEKFKGSLSTAAITIGLGFTPGLKRIVDGATALLNAWMPAITAFSEKIPAAFDAAIDKVLEFWPIIKQAFSGGGSGSIDGILEMAQERFFGFLGAAREVFNNLLAAAQTAIPMVQQAFSTLAPIVVAFAKTYFLNLVETIRWLVQDIFPSLWSIVKQTAAFFLDTLVPAFTKTQAVLRVVLAESLKWVAEVGWPALLSAARLVVDYLVTNVVPLLPELARQLRAGLGAAILWIAETGWPSLVAAAQMVSAWIIGTGIPAFQQLTTWLDTNVKPAVLWLINEGWPMLTSAATTVSDWITNEAIPRLTELWNWLEPKLRPIIEWLINEGWPMLKSAGQQVSDWIDTEYIPRLTELWNWLETNLRPVIQWFIDEGWPMLQSSGETVRKLFEDMTTWVKELWARIEQQGIWADLKQAFSDLWDAGKILVETFWPDMKQGAADIAENLPASNTVLNALVTVLKAGSTFIKIVAEGILLLAKGIKDLKEAASGMPDWLVKGLQSGAFGAPGVGIGNAISNVRTGMSSATGSAQTAAANFGPIDNSSRQAFVKSAFPYMLQAARGDRNLAEMMLAKAISENGTIGTGREFIGNNFSGIKGVGDAGSFRAMTWEMINGQRVNMEQDFAAFSTPQKGMEAFLKFLEDNKRYAAALDAYRKSGNVQQLFRDINMAGYATDPEWAAKVDNIRRNQVTPLVADLQVAQVASNQFSDATAAAGQTVEATQSTLQNVDQVIIAVATGLYQAREALITTGEANVTVAQNALPLIDALEKQGAISHETAEQLRSMSQEILAAGSAGKTAADGLDEAAQQAADVARRSREAEDAVSALADSFNDLPDWFTPTGQGGNALGIGKRAHGGPVSSGMPYLVGERGPELFVPSGHGTIIPNGAGAGGGIVVTLERGAVQVHGSVIAQQDLENAVAGAVTGALTRGTGAFG